MNTYVNIINGNTKFDRNFEWDENKFFFTDKRFEFILF